MKNSNNKEEVKVLISRYLIKWLQSLARILIFLNSFENPSSLWKPKIKKPFSWKSRKKQKNFQKITLLTYKEKLMIKTF